MSCIMLLALFQVSVVSDIYQHLIISYRFWGVQ